MSRPWQFSDDGARSPFDRQPAAQPAQPPSFQINVNRSKTQKWKEAQNYSYDGDDWGSAYDPYDEYGSYDNEGNETTTSAHGQTQAPASTLPSASALKHRKNSFDTGDEVRSFSADYPNTPRNYESARASTQPLSASGTPREEAAAAQREKGPFDVRRDFTQPAHVPPPLSFRNSVSPSHPPMPANNPSHVSTQSPDGTSFPPRKSSLSGSVPLGDSPSSPTPRSATASNPAKPLNFVRPSDIYRRMEEERERERRSLDSSRPSMDSAQDRPGEERERDASRERQPSAGSAPRFTGRRPSLGPVHEGTEPLHRTQHQGFTVDNPVLARAIGASIASDPSGHVASAERETPSVAPVSIALPQVSRVASAFGDEFWGESGLSERLRLDEPSHVSSSLSPVADPPSSLSPAAALELTPSQSASAQRTLEHQPSLGFRSVVHQAFDRHDDSSAPLSPISRDNSQSQHGSDTSGISPIMSRVPSTATPESRARANEARDAAVPPIAEETSQPASPASGVPSFARHSVTRKPSPSHSMAASADSVPAASFTPGYRRSLEPPSQESSPARTPELEYMKRLSHPLTAEPSLDRPTTADPVKTLPTDYTHREVDLADEASSGPGRANAGVAKASQAARTQFLNTHSPVLSQSPTFPKPTSRATSPSPGRISPGGSRVRELASQFNEIHALSRSNSSLSIGSKSSMQSWERSDDDPSLKRASTFDSDNGRDELDSPQAGNVGGLAPPQRPALSSDPSFRPHLPGEWVSYVSSADTTDNQDDVTNRDATPRKLGARDGVNDSISISPDTPRAVSRTTEDVDLTPSTVKQKLKEKDLSQKESSPLDAVKAAGDALGNALMASMGFGGGHETKDFASPDSPAKAAPVEPDQTRRPPIGNVYLRPVPADRPGSSNTISTVGPTPPAKDTPEGLNMNRSSGYFPPPVTRMQTDTTFSEDSEDEESDRLRREIEQSLSTTPQPVSMLELAEHQGRDQDALDGPANLREWHRSENIVPLATPPIASVPDFMVDHPAEPTPDIAPVNAPTFLDKRFSWEKRGDKSEPLFATEDTEPRAPYERPMSSQGLHIVNTNISSDSDSSSTSPVREVALPIVPESSFISPQTALEPTSGGQAHIHSTVSPITTPNVYPSTEGESRDVSALSSPLLVPENSDDLTHQSPIPEEPLSELSPTSIEDTNETDSHAPIGDSSRIPPFREILALKSPSQRISKYNDTRSQFATMDTGLSNWLSRTLSSSPEHSHLVNSSPALGLTTSNTTGSARPKTGPSIMKIARNLGPSRDNTSISTTAPSTAPAGPQRQASMSQSGAERMQAKGKDFMKSAGMFGGKASVGAKGLFAKAKGKLREGGSEKAPSANIPGKTSEPVEPSSNRHVSRPSTPNPSTALAGEKSTSSNGSNSVGSANTLTQEEDPSQSSVEMHRPPSRNNRLSAAFNRLLADGSQGRAKGRPDSVLLSSLDTSSANVQRGPISPFDMMNPADTGITPWVAGAEGEPATPMNPRLAFISRIGVLPSPAVEKQMSFGQDFEGTALEQDGDREEASALEKAEVDKFYDASPKVLKAEETEHDIEQVHSTDPSEVQPAMGDHSIFLGPASSTLVPDDTEPQPFEAAVLPQQASADAVPSFMSPVGSVLRIPKSRASQFTDVRDPSTDFVGPERTMSPVSSLGAETEDEHDQQKLSQGTRLERTVSPVDEARSNTQVQPLHAVLSSDKDMYPEPEGQQRIPQDKPSLTERASFTRPETERKVSRSSLPSQQRPPVDTARRTSYANWSSSRRASQVLEPATEGVATPHFESRRNSLILGYGDSPTIQRAPASQQDGYFTGLDNHGATGSNLSAGPYAEYIPTESTMAMPATSDLQQSRNFSPTIMAEHALHVQHEDGRPTMESGQLAPDYLGQQHCYAQPPFTGEAPSAGEYQASRFAPEVLDPRMQSAEYQLPGVGPPALEEVPRRGLFRGRAGDSGVSGTTSGQNALNAARINPNAVANRQHTFTGDELPTVATEKKDKKKSGIFGTFSRRSSVSDDWQNRLPSRGSNISVSAAGTSDPNSQQLQSQSQSQGYASPAVLSAREARESAARGNTLKKVQQVQQVQQVQRSSSNAAPLDPAKKEKRFSRLGSIFGRRNSQAGETKRGNRLTKPMPQPQSSAKSSIPTQGSHNTSAYSLSQQKNQGNLPSPPPPELQAMYQHQRGVNNGVQEVPQPPAAWTAPPPGGWYAPSGRPSSYVGQDPSQQSQHHQQQPTLPYVGPPAGFSPQHTTRRLHSEGFRREPRYMASSPGPSMNNSTAPTLQDPYYNGPQSMPIGAHAADRKYEQSMPSTLLRQNSNQQPVPRYQQRPGPPQQRPLSWRQSSYGSDNVPYHFDNFSAGTASPPPHNQHPQHHRGSSIGSETNRNLTPTHARTASFGAAPKDAYRMGNPYEGEQTLQRNYENSVLQAQQDAVFYTSSGSGVGDGGGYGGGDRGGYRIQPPPPLMGMYEPISANSSPQRRRNDWLPQQPNRSGTGAGYVPGPNYPQAQQLRSYSGDVPSAGVGQTPSSRRPKTPNDGRSRTNSLIMIDEDPGSIQGDYSPVKNGQQQPQQGGYYNINADRRRGERRESGGLSPGVGGGNGTYYSSQESEQPRQMTGQAF